MQNGFLFIFGLGYVGQHVGRTLKNEGWHVVGTTRTLFQKQRLEEQGFDVLLWDGDFLTPTPILDGVTHLLVTIPPNENGDIILKYIKHIPTSIQWVGYLSATSVYGDHQGALVTEDSQLKPLSSRGQQRFLAEMEWQEMRKAHSLPLHIFRLSGIYGPGHSVLESIRKGTAKRIDKPGHVFSRIHIDDIVSTLKASMGSPCPGSIYNLADDQPDSTANVIDWGCKLMGVSSPPLIPFDKAALSPALQEFYSESKRVSNHKIKESLGVRLLYPTYQEGLRHCIF